MTYFFLLFILTPACGVAGLVAGLVLVNFHAPLKRSKGKWAQLPNLRGPVK